VLVVVVDVVVVTIVPLTRSKPWRMWKIIPDFVNT
jgi:hypothetical protein